MLCLLTLLLFFHSPPCIASFEELLFGPPFTLPFGTVFLLLVIANWIRGYPPLGTSDKIDKIDISGRYYQLMTWKYWKLQSPTFSIILEIRAAGGRLQGSGSGGLDYFWNMVPGISGYPRNIRNLMFMHFSFFWP